MRVTVSRRIADVSKERELWVHSFRMPPDSNNSIKMEVGIEDCLHIEFEYNKSKWVVSHIHRAASLIVSQIPPEGCHSGEDFLPPRAHQN